MKRKDVLLILVPTFIFVLLWMTFSIYHSYINSTISEVANIQISPITPDFDSKTIQEINKRDNINPFYAIQPIISPTPESNPPSSPSATPAVIATPTPTISGKVIQSSSGGGLTQ